LTRDDRVILGDPSLPIPAAGWDLPRLAYDFRYVPPELFRSGGQLGAASDFYSLGCVAYELFHGQPPFVSDSHFELITRHDRDAVPSRRGSAGESALDGWLQRLLSKQPHQRFADLAELLLALEAVESAYRPRPRPEKPEICRPAPAAGDSPTLAPEAVGPHSSVHLLREQSLMDLAGRQSLVPLTGADGGLVTGSDYTPAPPGPPAEIPGYEILQELGRGGMGVVYKARQVSLNRLVALKMILSGAFAGRTAVSRFLSEAESIARLQHPNIMTIYELGEHSGLPYVVLEFCSGGSLARRLRGGLLNPREAAAVMAPLARAAHHAHQHGIIHRDIKPSNVLFSSDIPKLTDFGLAKRTDDDAAVTGSGEILGTPSYMAPEQASGRNKDLKPATDVYALGAMLYECLTGRPPFRAASVLDTLQQVLTAKAPPPSQLRPDLPRVLDAICLKCLEKDPSRRYPTAEALAEDLTRFLDGEPVTASRHQSGWRSWWPFARG
jgi:serine/threonine protein kinase